MKPIKYHLWHLEKKHEPNLKLLQFEKVEGHYEKWVHSQMDAHFVRVYITEDS
jgi:hypothetical protein